MSLFQDNAQLLVLWIAMSAGMLTLWAILCWSLVAIIDYKSKGAVGLEPELRKTLSRAPDDAPEESSADPSTDLEPDAVLASGWCGPELPWRRP